MDYKDLAKDINVGKLIYVDDGIQSFEVIEVKDKQTLRVRALKD